MLCTRGLGRMGYEVTGETDPVRAVQLVREDPDRFDAVITDLSLSGMSGSQLVREVLSIRADVPIIMMSGYTRPQDEEEAERLGVRALILKPDTIEGLARVLDQLFAARPVAEGKGEKA